MAMVSKISWLKSKLKSFPFILIGLILFGASLRFFNLNWDKGHILHPDERNIAAAVSRIKFFKQLNPKFFAYNGLPIYLYRLTGEVLNRFSTEKNWTYEWEKINLIGRNWSALFSTSVILLTYLVSKKIFKHKKTALLAAGLTTFYPTLIQMAHYGVTESMLTFWTMLIAWLSLIYLDKPSFKKLGLIGLICGLALATKTSSITFLIMPCLAVIAQLKKSRLKSSFIKLIILLVLALLFFFIFSPYNFLSWEKYMESMDYEGGIVNGKLKVVYVLQFLKTLPYVFHFKNLSWQMGPAAAILGLTGLGGLIKQVIKTKDKKLIVGLTWPLVYLLIVGSWYAKFVRYLVPAVPFLSLTAGWLLNKIKQKSARLGKLIILVTFLTTSFWGVAFVNIYRQENTRITASKWIFEHVQPGQKIINEHWDDGLPIPLNGYPNDRIYTRLPANIYDRDDSQKITHLAETLNQADYLIISSRRLWGTLINLPERYPITSHYYQQLFSQNLGYAKVAEVSSYPSFLGLTIPTRQAEETFQVYDHPQVMIFKNQDRLTVAELKNRLTISQTSVDKTYFNAIVWLGWLLTFVALVWSSLNLLPKKCLKKLDGVIKTIWQSCQTKTKVPKLQLNKLHWLLLLIFLAGGVLARVYKISQLPPGLHGDEAQSGLEAREILAGRPYYPYSAEVFGQTTAYFYLTALMFKIFGQTATAIRLTSVVLGLITLPLIFYILSKLFNPRIGLIGLFLLSFSRWHIQLSRVGMMIVSAPLLCLIIIGFLLLGLKYKKLGYLILAGLGSGLALNAYMSLRFIFITQLVILIGWFLKNKKERNLVYLTAFLTFGVGFLIGSPMIWYAIHNWDIFTGRARSIFVFRQPLSLALVEIKENLQQTLLAFHIRGPNFPHRNLPSAPLFDPVTGVLFLAGLIGSFLKKNRQYIIVWTIVFFMPIVVSWFSIDGGGDSFRISETLIPAIIFASLAADFVLKLMPKIFRPVVIVLFGLIIIFINWRAYFKVYAQHPDVFHDFHSVPVAVANYSNSLAYPHKIYLLSNWFYIDYLSIRFLSPQLDGEDFFTQLGQFSPKTYLLDNLNSQKPIVFIVLPFYNSYIATIENIYPGAELQPIYGGPNNKLLFTSIIINNND